VNSLLRRILLFESPASPWHADRWNTDKIIREELFSVERLEQHEASLAQAQEVTRKPQARRALNARLSDGLALLFTPPFDKTPLDPGYIKEYPPGIPQHWPRLEIMYKHASARYEILVENPKAVSRGVTSVVLDGASLPEGATRIPLLDDGATHQVRIMMG